MGQIASELDSFPERLLVAAAPMHARWDWLEAEADVRTGLRDGEVPWFGLRRSDPEEALAAGDSMNSLLQRLVENQPRPTTD